jgi:hypothetical protein
MTARDPNNAQLPKIIFLIAWFGPWPAWMRLYLESCRSNPTIDFVLLSDAPPPEDLPPNVRVVTTTFEDYRRHLSRALGIRPKWHSPYKLCDFKPVLGHLHRDLIKGYDYWGFGDVDVIYGDLRKFLDAETLSHDVISTHDHIVAGHLGLVRNTEAMLKAFSKPLHWRWLLSNANHKSFDERIFSMLFTSEESRRQHGYHRFLVPRLKHKVLFREQFSTPLPGLNWVDGTKDYPESWYWDRGRLTTSNTGDREFMYLHFTHWASRRWAGGTKAVWDHLEQLNRVTGDRPTSFRISADGFSDWPNAS